LYAAVLFEIDKTKLPERIAQAEKAFALRARELFYAAGDSVEEGQALDDAVYALRALRNDTSSIQDASEEELKATLPMRSSSIYRT
jgi:hypothetical protein